MTTNKETITSYNKRGSKPNWLRFYKRTQFLRSADVSSALTKAWNGSDMMGPPVAYDTQCPIAPKASGDTTTQSEHTHQNQYQIKRKRLQNFDFFCNIDSEIAFSSFLSAVSDP